VPGDSLAGPQAAQSICSLHFIKRLGVLSALFLCVLITMAQTTQVVVKGEVKDRETLDALQHASISVPGTNIATVTNEEGKFIIKSPERIRRIQISHVGYKSRYINVPDGSDFVKVMMQPSAIMLNEIIVSPSDPDEIMRMALSKIPENYGKQGRMMQTFYRETVQKRSRFLYVAEAVADMVKTGYHRGVTADRVAITKGRRLVSQRQGDTLGVKMQGGPVLGLSLDVVKNRDFLFDSETLSHYQFRMANLAKIEDRLQYVIELVPVGVAPYALYHGFIYIDNETFAFTRLELDLDMTDKEKASQLMLVKKPFNVKFKPMKMSLLINYKSDGGLYRMNYLRTELRFKCDWRRRLFSSSFRSVTEMVVTDVFPEAHELRGRSTFSSHDSFYDKVLFFDDPDFWKDYNIIEPTVSLEEAIGLLRKTVK
jgi:hypothetical protein